MSVSLDLQKVRTALMSDPAFNAGTPEQARAAYMELVEALPTVLDGQLEKKVTLPSLMEAKLAMIEHMLETGFIGKMFAAVPEDAIPFSAEEMTAMVVDALGHLRTPLMEMIHNTEAFLASYGMTERQVLARPQGGGFNAETLKAYDKGKLTIAGLLETQPAVLFVNG